MKIILLRHGQSEWNLQNKFTGWTDVELTSLGRKEAEYAANQIIKEKLNIETVHTSILKRAVDTTKIVTDKLNFDFKKIIFEWRLNERHYGALQGLNKSETAEKYGEEQVHIWRRSFDIPPPPVSIDDKRHPSQDVKFSFIDKDLPDGESLSDVINRLNPFWLNFKKLIHKVDSNHLIVAHSNSLRAIIKKIEEINDSDISSVNIATGVPLIYEIDKNWNILSKKFLISDEDLADKEKEILNQGKINK
tara:strand:+ start:159 stop:902 length:744 start_codon:yes stop_codon:yes gene_type:complete